MLKTGYRRGFRDLIDRSMIILVLRCDKCKAILARVIYPLCAKLDVTCDVQDHANKTGHRKYTALKHLVVYMSGADKELSNQLSEIQRKKLEEFLKFLKPGS